MSFCACIFNHQTNTHGEHAYIGISVQAVLLLLFFAQPFLLLGILFSFDLQHAVTSMWRMHRERGSMIRQGNAHTSCTAKLKSIDPKDLPCEHSGPVSWCPVYPLYTIHTLDISTEAVGLVCRLPGSLLAFRLCTDQRSEAPKTTWLHTAAVERPTVVGCRTIGVEVEQWHTLASRSFSALSRFAFSACTLFCTSFSFANLTYITSR